MMTKHDIWRGPIIGYGDASGVSSYAQFDCPGDFEYNPKAEAARKVAKEKYERATTRKAARKSELERAISAKNRAVGALKTVEAKLAHAEREKLQEVEAAKRLRYMQTCLMRLMLSLSSYVGETDGYLNMVEAFPYDEGYDVCREKRSVIVKNEMSRHLYLKVEYKDEKLSLGLYGGKTYKIHFVKTERCSEYVGITWHIKDLW